MRHHLNRLAQIVAVTLAVDYRFIYAARRDTVVPCGVDASKALVVAQVEVGLKTILGDIAFAVLVGVQRPGIDVDVGVELLNRDLVATCLQQLTDAVSYRFA